MLAMSADLPGHWSGVSRRLPFRCPNRGSRPRITFKPSDYNSVEDAHAQEDAVPEWLLLPWL